MIVGIGIDTTEIKRFVGWENLEQASLEKTLNPEEIEYCLANKTKCAERFASRFAAKEAFYKALGQMLPENNIPFLTICHNTTVTQAQNGRPNLLINWENILGENSQNWPKSHISITHTKNIATVIVILESL